MILVLDESFTLIIKAEYTGNELRVMVRVRFAFCSFGSVLKS